MGDADCIPWDCYWASSRNRFRIEKDYANAYINIYIHVQICLRALVAAQNQTDLYYHTICSQTGGIARHRLTHVRILFIHITVISNMFFKTITTYNIRIRRKHMHFHSNPNN